MPPLTLIIGKNSNLSSELSNTLTSPFVVISSRELLKNTNVLSKFKNVNKNIIFNNFFPASKINNFENYEQYLLQSIVSTSIVLDYFKGTKVNKIIYTSSSSVFGNRSKCNEVDIPMSLSFHSSIKISNEKIIEKYCTKEGINYTIARVFNMYGGDDSFSIISKIIKSAQTGNTLELINEGVAIRDFIHVRDVASIYSIILNVEKVNILNIGTGRRVSIKSILSFIQNYGFLINTVNSERKEIGVSVSNNKLLSTLYPLESLINIYDYIREELKFNK